jgi:hypothetical protein
VTSKRSAQFWGRFSSLKTCTRAGKKMVEKEKDLNASVASLILWRCSDFFFHHRPVEQLTKMSTPLAGQIPRIETNFCAKAGL